jgi:acetyltransferase-like isoleucine patch superfamily enzyme
MMEIAHTTHASKQLNAEFCISALSTDEPYRARIGEAAELHIDRGVSITEVSGTIRGENNTISIASGTRLCRLRLLIDGDHNVVSIQRGVHLDDCVLSISGNTQYGNFRGSNNTVHIGRESMLSEVRMDCQGSHNALVIGVRVYAAQKSELYLYGFGCSIRVGDKTSMTNAFLHAEEIETSIEVGEDNMIAAYVAISTGDKHPIYDVDSFQRVNSAQNIVTGKHVWMASGVQCLKGARVGDHCIIGKHTTIAGPIYDDSSHELAHHAVIYGMPARAHRTGVTWARDMFFDLDDGMEAKYPDAAAQTWCHRGHLLVRQGSEYLATGRRDEAEEYYQRSVQAYERALSYKHDFVYAYNALGVARVRLAQVALTGPDLDATVTLLKAALASFAMALKFDPSHGDSLLYQETLNRALESIEKVYPSSRSELDTWLALALVHLHMCAFEGHLFGRILLAQQYEAAQAYIARASAKGAVPTHILHKRDELWTRLKEWTAK